MRKFPIILTLVLAAAWGYTSWYWYVCNIKWLCGVTNQVETKEKTNMVRYDDVFTTEIDENVASWQLQEENILDTIQSGSLSDAPKLSSDDVLSANTKREEVKEEIVEEPSETEDTEEKSATWSTDAQESKVENTKDSDTISLCEDPLVGPIGLWANNKSSEVEKLEKFLVARWENVTLNGVYEQSEYEAVKKFQLEYRSDILDPWDIVEPTGYVFRTTVKKINEIACNTH